MMRLPRARQTHSLRKPYADLLHQKYIEYNGEEQTINVFWDVEEFLYAGAYRVDILLTER